MHMLRFGEAPLPRLILALTGALLLMSLSATQPRAATRFIIDRDDGYGIAECLEGVQSCGRTVADAWCEAHGLGAALAWGMAEDITASIAIEAAAQRPAPGSAIINCGD